MFGAQIVITEMGFWTALLLLVVFVIVTVLALCFCIIPLTRYLALRVVLFFRCVFCKAKFSPYGFASFFIPHFLSDKPDYMLLSGNKLYLIKLKSYRKTKTRIVFAEPKRWQIESLRGLPPTENEGILGAITMYFHKIAVHKRMRRSPIGLVRYAQAVNRSLADEPIDCVPVVLINPSIKELRTATKIDLIDGDTIFYGIVIANSFFPAKPEKSAFSGKDAGKIFSTARKAISRQAAKKQDPKKGRV